MSYVRQQFEKLGSSVDFKIKVRGDQGETFWINVSSEAVSRIADVLAEAEVQVSPVVDNS